MAILSHYVGKKNLMANRRPWHNIKELSEVSTQKQTKSAIHSFLRAKLFSIYCFCILPFNLQAVILSNIFPTHFPLWLCTVLPQGCRVQKPICHRETSLTQSYVHRRWYINICSLKFQTSFMFAVTLQAQFSFGGFFPPKE